MILGSLETLCFGVLVFLMIVFVALAIVALLSAGEKSPPQSASPVETPPPVPPTAYKLNHCFPLPDGYAYVDEEEQPPAIMRLDDGLVLSYHLEANVLTFEEPYRRADGTLDQLTRRVPRQSSTPHAS